MKKTCDTLVIGGGIVGCGALYQLAKRGVTDSVLVEMNELTSGTTWHSAGHVIVVDERPEIAALNSLSLQTYEVFEKETGLDIGRHMIGCVRIATNAPRLKRFERLAQAMDAFDTPSEMLDVDGIRRKFPLVNTGGLLGGMWTAREGYVDASMTTQAFAQAARQLGATIYRHTKVLRIERQGRRWRVETAKGTIDADNIVVAVGFWAAQLARELNINLPIVPVERQYIVTDAVPELKDVGFELPILRDYDVPVYFRQERESLLMGVHEPHTPFCFTDGIPESYAGELFEPDLERGEACILAGIERVPAFGKVGMKRVICGATSRTPDLSGLMGPVPGWPGLYILSGFAAGVSQGAAIGSLLAEWIVKGTPGFDVRPIDVSRFGSYATTYYVHQTLGEGHTYGASDPSKERKAGRPARISPLYFRQKAEGARFTARLGWECPSWFATDAVSDMQAAVAGECHAARKAKAMLDATSFTKYEVSGPGAADFLNTLCRPAVPQQDGAVSETTIVSSAGTSASFTVARLDREQFYLIGEPEAELVHLVRLESEAPADGSVTVTNVTGRNGALLLFGPAAESAIAPIAGARLDQMTVNSVRNMEIGYAPARVIKTDLSGLPVWQVHAPCEFLGGIVEALDREAGAQPWRQIGFKAFDILRSGEDTLAKAS